MLKRICLLALAGFLATINSVFAAVEPFEAQAEYMMENNESIKYAQETALNEAIRRISQQAAVVIRSHSTAADNQLSSDEMEMVTSTIVQVKEKRFQKRLGANDKIVVTAFVKAELDTDRAEQMSKELLAAKDTARDYEKIREEYSTAQSQYNALQGQYSLVVQKSAKFKAKQGIKLEREGKVAEAMKLYEEAIAADPNYARSYSRRGHIYRMQGKRDLAMKDYDKAYALDPKEAGCHYGRAIYLEQDGQKLQAAKEYRLFIEYSDILEYDLEIPQVLDKIIEIEGV